MKTAEQLVNSFIYREPVALTLEAESTNNRFIAPRLQPEVYPGEKPDWTGWILAGSEVVGVRWSPASPSPFLNEGEFHPQMSLGEGNWQDLDEWLQNQGEPTLRERFPLTVFGSNRCPGQLLNKFTSKTSTIVPAFNATISGYDVVYNSQAGNLGYLYADLYQGPETTDTEIEVSVLFLTKEQLAIIHESEKDYNFAQIGTAKLGKLLYGPESQHANIPAFAHIGKAAVYATLSSDGTRHPIAVEEVAALGRGLPGYTQTAMQVDFFGYDTSGEKQGALQNAIGNLDTDDLPAAYRKYMRVEAAGGTHSLAQRRALKAALKKALSPDEVIVVDPTLFPNIRQIDPNTETIPTWGGLQPEK